MRLKKEEIEFLKARNVNYALMYLILKYRETDSSFYKNKLKEIYPTSQIGLHNRALYLMEQGYIQITIDGPRKFYFRILADEDCLEELEGFQRINDESWNMVQKDGSIRR